MATFSVFMQNEQVLDTRAMISQTGWTDGLRQDHAIVAVSTGHATNKLIAQPTLRSGLTLSLPVTGHLRLTSALLATMVSQD